MLILSGATVFEPNGPISPASVLIDRDRILDVVPGSLPASGGDTLIDLCDHLVVPGFIDVHVHGAAGCDVLDGAGSVATLATTLPRFGVTSFCPTTVACTPDALSTVLAEVAALRAEPPSGSARVLPAHLESNFISPGYRGAQPHSMLRAPGECGGTHPPSHVAPDAAFHAHAGHPDAAFTAEDVLAVIDRAGSAVGVVTVAPEIDGGIDLVRRLARGGRRVSLGHSGAGYDLAREAFDAGACQATHLFNRMPPLGHREPGLVGAILTDERVSPEIICDGRHVHPGVIRMVVAAKGADHVMAITDGTAGAGLADGARGVLGGRPITVRDGAVYLDDGTLAGSALTFDAACRVLVTRVGLPLPDVVRLCSATPARQMGLADRGSVAPGFLADLVVLDGRLEVTHTLIGGQVAYRRL